MIGGFPTVGGGRTLLSVSDLNRRRCRTALSTSAAQRSRAVASCFAGPARRGHHWRRARSGADPAARAGLLGFEDAAERGRARRLHRARRAADWMPRRCAGARPASPRRARLLRRAGGPRHARARPAAPTATRRRPTCSSTGRSPRTSAACWRWPTPGCTLLGLAHRGAADRRAAERGQDGRRPLRRALRTTRRGWRSSRRR